MMKKGSLKFGIQLFLCMVILFASWSPSFAPLTQKVNASVLDEGDSGTRNIVLVHTPNKKAIVNGFSGDLRLPETVKVILDDESQVDVSVNWATDGLDLNTNSEYTLLGTLDLTDHEDILNSNNLIAEQNIIVRDELNLLINPSFESGTSKWGANTGTRSTVNDPVQEGASALKATGHTARYHYATQSVGDALESQGPGEYRMSGWAQLGEGLTLVDDDFFQMSLEVLADRSPNGDNKRAYYYTSWMSEWAYPDDDARTIAEQKVILNDTEYKLASNRMLIKWEGAITAADFSFVTADNTFPSTLYMDNAELVPLNVTLPKQDIINFSDVSSPPVYVGTSFGDLELPSTVNATLENGSSAAVPILWDDSSYLGEQEVGSYTITGLFDLTGTSFTNNNDLKVNVTIVVRELDGELVDTYYFASNGDDSNDGLTPETAKQSIANIKDLMTPGTILLLNRGDEWYVPGLAWDFSGIKGTASAPIMIGAYGSGTAPVVADMYKLSASQWEETTSGSGVWSTEFGVNVRRLYVDEQLWAPADSLDVITDNHYVQANSKVYVKSVTAPDKVEIIPNNSKTLVKYSDSEYITIKDITLKGGGNWVAVSGAAPTKSIVFDSITLKQITKYGFSFSNGSAVDAVNKDLMITDSYLDRVWSSEMYAAMPSELTSDGIQMRNAIDGAIIRRNTIINFGHTGINGEVLNDAYPGVNNMIYEDNIITKGESNYLRAWEVTGLAGTAQNNIVRRNVGYDLTNSSHFLGENNFAYSNIFHFLRRTTANTSNIQPYAIDMIPWNSSNGQYVARNNIIANNTFYNTVYAIRVNGSAVGENTIVNNLFVDWEEGKQSLLIETTSEPQIVKNNGFWNVSDVEDVMRVGDKTYTASEANVLMNISGNIQADPAFSDAANNDFSLTADSPYKDAGLPISLMMDEGFTDFYGNPFDANAPSIGAIQYQRPINNLLTNPGYEASSDDWAPWNPYNRDTENNVSIVTGEAALNGNSIYVKNRAQHNHGSGQDVLSVLNNSGPGDYYVQVWAKLGEGASPIKAIAALEIAEEGGSNRYYNTYSIAGGWPDGYGGKKIEINDSEYTKISNTIPLNWDNELTNARFYFQTDADIPSVPDIYLDEWVLMKVLQIVSVDAISDKAVLSGTEFADLDLPLTIEAELDDGSSLMLPVVWNANDYDANVLGAHTITGSVTVPDGISNRANLNVSVEVVVKGALDIMNIIDIENQTFEYGLPFDAVTPKLPTKVDAVLEDGTQVALDVTWEEGTYDGEVAGEYTLTAELQLLPTTSNNHKITPQMTITVNKRISKGEELLVNPDFEDGIEGWSSPWGGTIEPVTDNLSDNALLSVRGATSNTAVQDVTAVVSENGQGPYYVQTWLKAAEGTLQDARTYVRIEDDNGQRWLYVPAQKINSDEFTKLSGTVNITWSGTLKEVMFAAVETGEGSTGNVIIANASFKSLELLKNAGFEDGIQFWDETIWVGELASINDPIHRVDGDSSYAGSKALGSVNRTVAWRGPVQDITSILKKFGPGTYRLSAHARLPEGNNKVKMGIRYILNDNGIENLLYSEIVDINATEYTLLEAEIDLAQWNGTLTSAQFIISTTANPVPANVYYDDFSMTADHVLQDGPSPDPATEPTPTPDPSTDPTPTPTPDPTPTPTPTPTPDPTPTPTPDPTTTPAPGVGTVNVSSTMENDGIAHSEVSAEDLEKVLSNVANKVIMIKVEADEAANGVNVTLPGNVLADAAGTNIVVDTGLAIVQLSPDKLKESTGLSGKLKLSVQLANQVALSDEASAIVGNNPVYDFNLSVDDNPIVKFANHTVKVQLKYTLKPNENPNKIVVYYIDGNGKLEVVKNAQYNATTGTVEFYAAHFSQYAVGYNDVTFLDLTSVSWAKEAIEALASREIIQGVDGINFQPNEIVTREAFLMMLMNALELNDQQASGSFSDVEKDKWYSDAVVSAKNLGITNGQPDGTFGLNSPILRQDMAVFVYRAAQVAQVELSMETNADQFLDHDDVADYAAEAVRLLHGNGLINGIGQQMFDPNGQTTRAQAAVMIWNLFQSTNE